MKKSQWHELESKKLLGFKLICTAIDFKRKGNLYQKLNKDHD